MIKIKIYRDQALEYRWRLVASNNEIVAWSEGYTTKQNAILSAQWTKRYALNAPIVDLTI